MQKNGLFFGGPLQEVGCGLENGTCLILGWLSVCSWVVGLVSSGRVSATTATLGSVADY